MTKRGHIFLRATPFAAKTFTSTHLLPLLIEGRGGGGGGGGGGGATNSGEGLKMFKSPGV